MHIAVDCRSVHPHMGGIGRAALGLMRALGDQPRGHRLTMLVAADRVGEISVKGVHILPVEGAMIDERFDQLLLPSVLEQCAPDVYLNTTFSIPAVKTTKIQMSIIHDIVFEDHPAFVEPRLRHYLSRWSRYAATYADHVLTDSDYSRERIGHVYGVEPSRLSRVHLGVDPSAFIIPEQREIECVRLKFGLARPFILYLGTIERKKGVLELLSAYQRACDLGVTEQLVLAGGKGAPDCDVEAQIQREGCSENVRLLGFIEETDKKALLKACSLFVYPSLYEGFGFPPLEAMALGVPTLVSDQTSLPEVVGDAAIITCVQDTAGLAQAILRGLRDAEFRGSAATLGPAQARCFNWGKAAGEVLDLCERLGGE